MRREGEAVRDRFSREAVLAVVDQYCQDKYTFFYLPYDQKTGCNLGYGYIDMVDLPSVAALYVAVGDARKVWGEAEREELAEYAKREGLHDLLWKAAERRGSDGGEEWGQQDLAEYCSDWSVMSSEEKYHPLFFKEVTCMVDGKEVKKMERYTPPVVLKVKNEE